MAARWAVSLPTVIIPSLIPYEKNGLQGLLHSFPLGVATRIERVGRQGTLYGLHFPEGFGCRTWVLCIGNLLTLFCNPASLDGLGFPGLPDKPVGGRTSMSRSEHARVLPQGGGGGPTAALRMLGAVAAHARRGFRGGAWCGCD